MFRGMGVTSSVTQAAGAPEGGVSALPKTLVNERADPGNRGLFQKIKRTRDIGVNETLPAVSDDMGFVQSRSVDYGIHTLHASLDKMPVNDWPHLVGEFCWNNVDTNDFSVLVPQRADQRLA
jgi:hypothetical protein